MQQNISIEILNKFAPDFFSFKEDKQGKVQVLYEKNENMNHFENVGYTDLTIEELKNAFKPFYNFTHRIKDGKLIDAPIDVLPPEAAKEDKEKAVNNYMRSRSYDFNIDNIHLAQGDEFEKMFNTGQTDLNNYLDTVNKRINNHEEYKNNEKSKKELRENPPKKTLFGFGDAKKREQWSKNLDSFDADKENIEKNRYSLQNESMKHLAKLKDNHYGDLFTQMVLQSTFKAVEEDVSKHYHQLVEQHALSKSYNKLDSVRQKLNSYGADFGEVSGVVKADNLADSKINKTEYKEPARENKIQKTHDKLMEKTFGGKNR